MKIIKKGQDFKYHVQIFDKDTGEEIQITLQNYYKVQIYTNDSRTWVDATSYIDASNMLQVDTQLLSPLSSGQIHIKIMFSEANSIFQDKNYDYMNIISTDSYYDSEDMIDNLEKVQWGQIFGDITKQEDLINLIKKVIDDKDINKYFVGITQNEYEQLKVNNQLKDNTLYVITDDNEGDQIFGDITKQEDLISFIKNGSDDKSVIGITQNEYEHLKTNNQLKDNTLYVITDDNEGEQIQGDITKQADLISFIKNGSDVKVIIGITQNEYEHLKTNNQLKENTLYVIIDDNE